MKKIIILLGSLLPLFLLSTLICMLVLFSNSTISTYLDNTADLLGINDRHQAVSGTARHCTSIECFISNNILTQQNVSYITYTPLSSSFPKSVLLIHNDNVLITIIKVLQVISFGIFVILILLLLRNKAKFETSII